MAPFSWDHLVFADSDDCLSDPKERPGGKFANRGPILSRLEIAAHAKIGRVAAVATECKNYKNQARRKVEHLQKIFPLQTETATSSGS